MGAKLLHFPTRPTRNCATKPKSMMSVLTSPDGAAGNAASRGERSRDKRHGEEGAVVVGGEAFGAPSSSDPAQDSTSKALFARSLTVGDMYDGTEASQPCLTRPPSSSSESSSNSRSSKKRIFNPVMEHFER